MIAEEYRGKSFRQIAPRLRWRRGPHRINIESFRPMNELTGQIVGEPPVIAFEDDDDVDVADWLARGRIEPSRAKPHAPLTDTEAHKVGRELAPMRSEAMAEGGGGTAGG
jgi:hypothetical protein